MQTFLVSKPIIGVVHLPPLPGSPGAGSDLDHLIADACADALSLADGGVDGIIMENFGDAPFYPDRVPPHVISIMTRVGHEISKQVALPIGVNVLRNDASGAIAVAVAIGARFIRVNVHIGAALTDQGWLSGQAHETIRYRSLLGSDLSIFADILVKHSVLIGHPDPVSIARDTVERGKADALVVTGPRTGTPPAPELLAAVKGDLPDTPVFIGSGLTAENVQSLLALADGCIVGSSLKRGGNLFEPVDPERVRLFTEQVESLRGSTGP